MTPEEIKQGGYQLGPAPIVPPAPLGNADVD